MKQFAICSLVFALGMPWSAGEQRLSSTTAASLRSAAELEELTAPVALYPDALVAHILRAALVPGQVVSANRFLREGKSLETIDRQSWDPSVKALARYQEVLRFMDDNFGWTTRLGQAVAAQQSDVMDAIQRLRAKALALGNLRSTPELRVVEQNGMIQILPANPEIIYVPVYDPDVVFITRDAYLGYALSFGRAWPVGPWLGSDLDWYHHQIFLWPRHYWTGRYWWHHRFPSSPETPASPTRGTPVTESHSAGPRPPRPNIIIDRPLELAPRPSPPVVRAPARPLAPRQAAPLLGAPPPSSVSPSIRRGPAIITPNPVPPTLRPGGAAPSRGGARGLSPAPPSVRPPPVTAPQRVPPAARPSRPADGIRR
jgi:hypothetical protein